MKIWSFLRRACSLVFLQALCVAVGASQSSPLSPTNIFSPVSSPARSGFRISEFVLEITGAIFLVVFSLLAYAVIKFRERKGDEEFEPPQVYGSNQMEVAWTILPVLIVVVLFLSTAQVIHRVQDAAPPGECPARNCGGPSILVGVPVSRLRICRCQ